MAVGCHAGIDIGTNSVRLLIRDGEGQTLERHMHITRLGQGVDATGSLQPTAVERTLRVLGEYATLCRKYQVQRLRMAATSAARDARNRDEFFARVRAVVGAEPELLSGEEEARLSFRGATAGFPSALAPFVVVDIGGGSTEFACGAGRSVAGISLNVGGVRLTEKFLHADPPLERELGAARDHVLGMLGAVVASVELSSARTWLGVAGTVTSLAALALGLETYDPSRTHGYRLERDRAFELFSKLAKAPLAERRTLLLQPQRAEVIVGGGVVLTSIFEYFELEALTVSETDILDGLAAS